MSQKDQRFIKVEIKYLNDAKYFDGINKGKDPGEKFVLEMIELSASSLREKWNNSCCKNCFEWEKCGHLLKEKCENFNQDKEELKNV